MESLDDYNEVDEEAIRRFQAGEQYGVSTDISGNISRGYGNLDFNGFWEHQIPAYFFKRDESELAQSIEEIHQSFHIVMEEYQDTFGFFCNPNLNWLSVRFQGEDSTRPNWIVNEFKWQDNSYILIARYTN